MLDGREALRMELWQALLVGFGGNAALLIVLGFLGRSIFQLSIAKDLEKFKQDLQLSATEHEIRFRRLDEQRACVVADMYKLLVKAYWEAESFTNPIELAGEPDKKEKYATAQVAIADYYRFFERHKIYLSPELCANLESFAQELRRCVLKFGVWVGYEHLPDQAADRKIDDWNSAWKRVREEIPRLREAIETEFRGIIGTNRSGA
jgi:hypothetical protein